MHIIKKAKSHGKLSSLHDLTTGERAGLKQHGISPEKFDGMSEKEQREWKEELDIDAYSSARKMKI